MKDVSDVIGWIVSFLGALFFINYRASSKDDSDKFKMIFAEQKNQGEKIVENRSKIETLSAHYTEVLDDIKSQGKQTAKDISEIKVAIASIPKRKEDR